jgi:hypothetical protein
VNYYYRVYESTPPLGDEDVCFEAAEGDDVVDDRRLPEATDAARSAIDGDGTREIPARADPAAEPASSAALALDGAAWVVDVESDAAPAVAVAAAGDDGGVGMAAAAEAGCVLAFIDSVVLALLDSSTTAAG